MRRIQIIVIGFIFLFSVSTSFSKDDFQEIKAQDVKKIMDSGKQLLLLNPLSDIEFNQQHIPGSVNIPMQKIETSDKLPKEKDFFIITYCLGRKCTVSVNAAKKLSSMGYTNIKIFKDGIPGWAKAGYELNTENALKKVKVPKIKIKELKSILDEIYLIDIRSKKNRSNLGWIKQSHHIPLSFLSSRLNEIPKNKKIVVMDHAGKQVLTASLFLISKGYKDVHRVQGGMMKWVTTGNSVEK
ncbi:sulfurtransferase [Candidatus Magnetomorum sp. HK-1]|nr:sulfurtransferase [Candidatus Magnetomorum sp. HK-1]